MKVYVLTVDGDVWGVYSSMDAASLAQSVIKNSEPLSEFQIATRMIEG